jgi:hypothetical protein
MMEECCLCRSLRDDVAIMWVMRRRSVKMRLVEEKPIRELCLGPVESRLDKASVIIHTGSSRSMNKKFFVLSTLGRNKACVCTASVRMNDGR